MHRTFVELSDYEYKFLLRLRAVVRKTSGKRMTLSGVIRGVVRDYRQVLEEGGDPDFLSIYRNIRQQK